MDGATRVAHYPTAMDETEIRQDIAADTRPWGLILAGGAGRRVDGADKGLLAWRSGEPLVAAVAQRLRPQVRGLFISCNRNQQRYAAWADALLEDELPDFAGPLAGLASFPWRSHPGRVLICPCDTPDIPLQLASLLAAPMDSDPALQVSHIRTGERAHYLHALLRCEVLAELPRFLAGGGRAVRHWYATLHCHAVRMEASELSFRNLNQLPDDSGRPV